MALKKHVIVRTHFVVLIALVGSMCSCGQRINSSVISDTRLVVGPRWTQIKLPRSVAADWDYQIVELTLSTKFSDSTSPWGMKLSDGSVVLPQLKLITDRGDEDIFHFDGFLNSNVAVFGNHDIARGTHFEKLEIISAKPLALAKIVWISYMPQDTKTGNP